MAKLKRLEVSKYSSYANSDYFGRHVIEIYAVKTNLRSHFNDFSEQMLFLETTANKNLLPGLK